MPNRLPSPDRSDRLAVRTFIEAGEEVAFGEFGVTEEERSAAGRQTIAERTRELLCTNRKRAAEHLATSLPDDEDVLRVWSRRDPSDLRARLGENSLDVWAEGDVLHVLVRGEDEDLRLGGGIQPRLWPVDGAGDLWEASLRIRNLQGAVITIAVFAVRGDTPCPAATTVVWRGPQAGKMRRRVGGNLAGTVKRHDLTMVRSGPSRTVTVYLPPGLNTSRPVVGCVLADGESTQGFAEVLEAAITDGSVPPILLVGIHSGAGQGTGGLRGERRAQEYVPGWDRYRFDVHFNWVINDVIPWVTRSVGADRTSWLAAGFSNGGAWAIAAAQRRPDIFKGVAAFSAGVVPRRLAGRARSEGVRHYLASGVLESGFRRSTKEWAERLGRARLEYHHHEWAGGHDPVWWENELPGALAWLIDPGNKTPT